MSAGAVPELVLAGGLAILALGALLALVVTLRRRGQEVPESPGLWEGRAYACPECAATMLQGWVLLGRGAIWSPLGRPAPGPFANLLGALPSTISLSIRPASNQAWHCPQCRLLLLDHSRLVRPRR